MTSKTPHIPSAELFEKAMAAIAGGAPVRASNLLTEITGRGEKASPEERDRLAQSHNQLGIIALRNGDPETALSHFQTACRLGEENPALLMNLGVAQSYSGRAEESTKTLRRLVETHPGLDEAWFHLGVALKKAGRGEEAIGAFHKYLKTNPENPEALLEMGLTLEDAGKAAEAWEFFQKAIQLEPSLYVRLYQAAEKLCRAGQTKTATEILARAGKVLPKDPIPHHMMAVLYQDLGKKDLAEEYLKKSLSIAPTPESYGQLAALYEKSSQLNDAWAISNLGLRAFPDDPYMKLTLARVERRAKKFDSALARLTAIAGTTGDPKLEGQIAFQLGWLYDQRDDTDTAFDWYVKAKRLAAGVAKPEEGDKTVSFGYIEAMKKLDLNRLANAPYKPRKNEPREVVFLVGFPRSGTTLLNQVLDAHPGLVALEEAPTLPRPAGFVEVLGGGYPAALENLDAATVERMRAVYFEGVRAVSEFSCDGILIDKLPLNLVHLPLIWTMFPKARIILALRHPFGAVLSNFMHNFKLNDAMANMFTLADISTYYDGVMGLWGHFREEREFAVHTVKYEDVVADLKGEGEKLCRFLGVPWSPEMLDYSKHARKKGLINTPSYHQVTQPLYRDSLERWRRYEKFLAPCRELLAPYCKKFGYKLSSERDLNP